MAQSAAYTPAPWRVGRPQRRDGNVVLPIFWDVPLEPGRRDGERLLAWVFRNNVPHEQFEPNARLIAAVPTLHGALSGLEAAIAAYLSARASRRRAAIMAADIVLTRARGAARDALTLATEGR